MQTPQLYGQSPLAEFCEYVLASLFEVTPTRHSGIVTPAYGREGVDTPPYTPPIDGAPRKEPPLLIEFIAYALYRTRLPIAIVHQSLLLLSRLKQRYPSARGTSSSPHRLFLSSLMLSAKISMDDTYSNKSWAIVGSNYFALKEVNQMERELFAFLGWNVVATKEELDTFIAAAELAWADERIARAASAVAVASAAAPLPSPAVSPTATPAVLVDSSKRRRLEEAEAARESRHQQAKNAARALLRPHTYRHTSPVTSAESSAASSASVSSAASPNMSFASPMSLAPSTSTSVSQAASPESAAVVAHTKAAAPSTQHRYSTRAQTSRQHAPLQHSTYSSASSSTASSAFPSATHSPYSPASAPLSAGPQTPASACMDYHPHINESPDFPEAAGYVLPSAKGHNKRAASRSRSRHVSPARGSLHAATVSAPALIPSQ